MLPELFISDKHCDPTTGCRHRIVYIYTENSQPHTHDYYEIFLTLEDNVIHNINGHRVKLPYGSLVFIRKNDVHYYEHTTSRSPSLVNLAFKEELIEQLCAFLTDGFPFHSLLTSEQPPTIQLQMHDIQWILQQLQTLNAIPLEEKKQLTYHYRILLFKLFIQYFSSCNFTKEHLSIPSWLRELNQQMQKPENFSQGASHMVNLSGKCRSYLGRMLKRYYGKNIPDYINDIRLNYWANSLLNTEASILDICYECGFENISWAYTLFKKKYGISPSKYRKSNH